MKAALDQREADLNTLEADVQRRSAIASDRENKNARVMEKANGRVQKIRAETTEELERMKKAHEEELERVRQELSAVATTTTAAQDGPTAIEQPSTPIVSGTEGLINTEDLPRPTVTADQLNNWIKTNNEAKMVIIEQIKTNMNKAMKPKNEELAKLRDEVRDLKAQALAQTAPIAKESEPVKSSNTEEELTKLKAEHETALKEALEKKEESLTKMYNMRIKIKDSTLANIRAKCNVVEKAAKETPKEEVAKVWEQAVEAAKAAPAAAPSTPKVAISTPAATAPAPVQATTSQLPQPNGMVAPVGGQPFQGSPAQQPQANQFYQSGQGVAPNAFNQGGAPVALNQFNQAGGLNPFSQAGGVNPFHQGQNQMGRGLAQPGFAGQNQAPHFGQGRGDGFGTGPQALRGVLQSNIPRGGAGATGIPQPGGRGGGRGYGQQPFQQNQPQNQFSAAGASQIGRGGGGRGGRGGRGGASNTTGSPSQGNLNPVAQQFQPGAGRGQKRGAEDDSEGGARGGKRARGGGRGSAE